MSNSQDVKNSWCQSIIKRLNEINAPAFLNQIGIDFESNFVKSLASAINPINPYAENFWEIWPHSLIPNGVLHCYPKQVGHEKVIWEEWFLLEGQLHHHVLSNFSFPSAHGVWTPEKGDKDHPLTVLNNSWHYINSASFVPSLLLL